MESKGLDSYSPTSKSSSKCQQASPPIQKSEAKDDDITSNITPTVTINSVDVNPEDECLVSDGIELEVGFLVDSDIDEAFWKITVS